MLAEELGKSLKQPFIVKQRLGSVGFIIPEQGSKPYTAFVKKEIDTWSRVIKTAGIKPQ